MKNNFRRNSKFGRKNSDFEFGFGIICLVFAIAYLVAYMKSDEPDFATKSKGALMPAGIAAGVAVGIMMGGMFFIKSIF